MMSESDRGAMCAAAFSCDPLGLGLAQPQWQPKVVVVVVVVSRIRSGKNIPDGWSIRVGDDLQIVDLNHFSSDLLFSVLEK